MPLSALTTTHGDNQLGLWRPSFTRHRHHLYIFGGGGIVNTQLHALDLRTGRWESLRGVKGTPPTKRYGHTASLYGNYIVIFGGSSEAQHYCKDVVLFDMEKREWVRPKVTEPEGPGMALHARYLHTATVYQDQLYVYGGFARNSECTYVLEQMSVLDLKTWTWSAPVQVPARYNHSATLLGDSLYVYAGKDESGRTVPDLFKVHLPTRKVLPQSGLSGDVALLKSQHFTEAVEEDKLVMFGKFVTQQQMLQQQDGDDTVAEENSYGLWMLDLETLDWKQLPRERILPPDPSAMVGSVWNYFTTVPASEIYEDDESGERRLFVLLGNMEQHRPQPYDHFRDMLIVDPETVGLWQVTAATMNQDLSRMLLDDTPKQWTDFCIYPAQEEGEDVEPVRVHRSVLWSRWPHFRRLVASGMQEVEQGGLKVSEHRDVVESFVWYLYTDDLDPLAGLGQCEDLEEIVRIVCGVLLLANLYLLPRLAKLCCQRLSSQGLTPRTAGTVFQAAVEAGEPGLQQLAQQFMCDNFGAVMRHRGLEMLNPQAMREFVAGVPESASLSSARQV